MNDAMNFKKRIEREVGIAKLINDPGPPPTLRDRIAAALTKKKGEEAESERVRIARDRQTLEEVIRKVLGVKSHLEFSQEGERVVTEIEGIKFSFQHDEYGQRLVLLRTCPRCMKTADKFVSTLEAIGAALEDNDLGWRHNDGYCTKDQSRNDAAEGRLIEALREYIAECASQIGD